MAQVRIEVDAGITVEVVEGNASAVEISALQAQVVTLQGKINLARAQLASLAAADVSEDAARAAVIAALE